MKSYQTRLIVFFGAFACVACAVFVAGTALNARSANLALVAHVGKELAAEFKLRRGWPDERVAARNFTDSTACLLALADGPGKENIHDLLCISARTGAGRNSGESILTPENNIWIVVKSLPENAPGNVVTLATRNIDVSSLRTRMLEGDMGKLLKFKKKKERGVLKKWAVLVYNDGCSEYIRCGNHSGVRWLNLWRYWRRDTTPFDLTACEADGIKIKYLTPDGETTPENP